MKNINPLNNKEYSDEYHELKKKWEKLPANTPIIKKKLYKLLDKNQIIILSGETGSGKTTQVPKLLLEYFDYKKDIVCTQPRQLAVDSISKYVAKQLDVEIGKEVGFQYRFKRELSKDTKLTFMTDGTLVNKLIYNPDAKNIDSIIIDEAHERSIQIDTILLLLLKLLKKKSKMKIIIMSATAEIEKFYNYFSKFKIDKLNIPGRTFPVDKEFLTKPIDNKNYIHHIVEKIVEIINNTTTGDILVFLPGKKEINTGCRLLQQHLEKDNIDNIYCAPLYSALHSKDRDIAIHSEKYKMLDKKYNRKVVISTNIAEASVTIDGVIYVVESGYQKENIYHPEIRGSELSLMRISKASIRQRIGRAGRTRPGVAYLMYTEKEYKTFPDFSIPEYQKENITQQILQLLSMKNYLKDTTDLTTFLNELMDPPHHEFVNSGLETLIYLDAINEKGKLTDIGYTMSKFSVEPEISKMILMSPHYNCIEEIMIIAGMLTTPSINEYFINARPDDRKGKERINKNKKKFKSNSGDHFTLMNIYKGFKTAYNKKISRKWCYKNTIKYSKIYESWRAVYDIKKRFQNIIDNNKLPKLDYTFVTYSKKEYNIIKCILSGYFMNVVYKDIFDYEIMKINKPVKIFGKHKQDWLFYSNLRIQDFNVIDVVSCIFNPKWLVEIAPHFYNPSDFYAEQKSVVKKLYKNYPCKKLKNNTYYKNIVKKICNTLT